MRDFGRPFRHGRRHRATSHRAEAFQTRCISPSSFPPVVLFSITTWFFSSFLERRGSRFSEVGVFNSQQSSAVWPYTLIHEPLAPTSANTRLPIRTSPFEMDRVSQPSELCYPHQGRDLPCALTPSFFRCITYLLRRRGWTRHSWHRVRPSVFVSETARTHPLPYSRRRLVFHLNVSHGGRGDLRYRR
jgi:hypothetical protein